MKLFASLNRASKPVFQSQAPTKGAKQIFLALSLAKYPTVKKFIPTVRGSWVSICAALDVFVIKVN